MLPTNTYKLYNYSSTISLRKLSEVPSIFFIALLQSTHDHILKNNLSNNILNTEQLFIIPHTTICCQVLGK